MIVKNARNKTKKLLRKAFLKKGSDKFKDICEAHKNEWVPLSTEEMRKYRKNQYIYTLYKNFELMNKALDGNDEPVDLSKYLTPKQYKCEILARLNKLDHTVIGTGFLSILVEKNYFPILFPEFVHPKIFVRRIKGVLYDGDFNRINEETALSICSERDALVFKISRDSKQGKGVKRVERADYKQMLSDYGNNFIVQDLIKQHENFAYFNDSSVNIIRILSMFWRGTVYILCSKLRVGAPGTFTDLGVSELCPLEIGVNDDGTFFSKAHELAKDYKIYDNAFGKPIIGHVPNYEKMKELVIKAHSRYPDYGILGWDLTLDEDGNIVFIEVNSRAPSIEYSQCIFGPFFSMLSKDGSPLKDEIMNEPIDLSDMNAF